MHCLWGIRNACATVEAIKLLLLCEVVDGLGEAVEPGVAGHQHQEAHGDHLHCAGEREILVKYKSLESHLQVPSVLFSGMVSSLHLSSFLLFSSTRFSFLARLFLGAFDLEDIFL